LPEGWRIDAILCGGQDFDSLYQEITKKYKQQKKLEFANVATSLNHLGRSGNILRPGSPSICKARINLMNNEIDQIEQE
jgi:hypothetical protein